VTRQAVAGTRKVSWEDYDEIVEQTGKKLNEAANIPTPPGGQPAEVPPRPEQPMTRRATWEETEELARSADDEGPLEDEGI
jgi:hypothetical protein